MRMILPLTPKMKNRVRKFIIFAALFFFPLAGHAQILEVDPELIGREVSREPHAGLTLQGSSGLITIPTADFKEKSKISIAHKVGTSDQNSIISDTYYIVKKTERFTGLAYNIQPGLELSIQRFHYNRSSTPYLAGLNFEEATNAFGVKYSGKNGKQDFCFGSTFAPMSLRELNQADLSQIENLRNVYMTVSEDILTNIRGYLHAKTSFTRDQKILLAGGSYAKIHRKNFIVSGIGLDYSQNSNFSFICEAQFFNYRDLFPQDSTRYSFNSGLRFGGKGIGLEGFAMSLNQGPRYYFGGYLGF